jgi:acyl transferase domain-containing protein
MATGRAGGTSDREPVAILGIGCKLPGDISRPDELVAMLRNQRDCIREIPPDRWKVDEFYDADAVSPGKTYSRHGGFMSNIDHFDAGFFGISAAEADRLDPQQRVLLQTVWHALEHAGQAPEELVGSNTGVFLGMMNTNDYCSVKRTHEGLLGVNAFDAVADVVSITAGRISHFFGLEGPCFAVDTACSGSMVALHLACQSIHLGECDAAIVAGVSAVIYPAVNVAFSKVGLLARSERCKSFDAQADGYVRSEGCVALFLRRQASAQERRQRILATIVGTAINQDGRTPALTAPNGRSQKKVLEAALARAGVDPFEVGFVEAHGTGTPVGDPIEMNQLVDVYGRGRASSQPLYVGSIKSNLGHTESTAGALGVAKAALSLHLEQIFPNVHFTRFNPDIQLQGAPIRVPTTTVPWPRGTRPRRAGVNSFGYSGTNAHAILEEAPLPETPDIDPEQLIVANRPRELVTLSAKSLWSLEALADAWIELLGRNDATLLSDLAYSAATGRAHLSHRLAITGRTREEIADKLRAFRQGHEPKGLVFGRVRSRQEHKLAFVFTGQGAHYAGMGRQLYDVEPGFRRAIDTCAQLLAGKLDVDLHALLFGAAAPLLEDTRYAQVAIFALDYALYRSLADLGVEPDVVMGHSIGEFVALVVAEVLSLEDALTLVVERGRLMSGLPRDGKMVALAATPDEVEALLADTADVSLAAINGERATVVSGRSESVDAVAARAAGMGRKVTQLHVSHAFHSPLVEPILEELTSAASRLQLAAPTRTVLSNVTGTSLPHEPLTADYFARHARQPVLFAAEIKSAIEAGCTAIIEVGPHPALVQPIMSLAGANIRVCTTLQRDGEDTAHWLDLIGALHVHGVSVKLERLFARGLNRSVELPLYPFRPEHHWLKVDAAARPQPTAAVPDKEIPLLGRCVQKDDQRVVFEARLSTSVPWVDHRIHNNVVFPAAGYLEMLVHAVRELTADSAVSIALSDMTFEAPLVLAYAKPKLMRLTLEKRADSSWDDARFSFTDGAGDTVTYCRGTFVKQIAPRPAQQPLDTLRFALAKELDVAQFYTELRKQGMDYGAAFSCVRELRSGDKGTGEALARVSTSRNGVAAQPADGARLCQLFEGSFHTMAAAALTLAPTFQTRSTFVPLRIGSFALWKPLPASVWAHASVAFEDQGRSVNASLQLFDDTGEPLATIESLQMRQLTAPSSRAHAAAASTRSAPHHEQTRVELLASLRALPTSKERIAHLSGWVMEEVKDTLGQAADEYGVDLEGLDPSAAIAEIGMDSLLVTELQRRLQEKLDFRFPAMQGLDYESIESLAVQLLGQVLPETANAAQPGAV